MYSNYYMEGAMLSRNRIERKKHTALLFFLCLSSFFSNDVQSKENKTFLHKQEYRLSCEPIDVVIPCTDKDIETLDLCIEGIRKNGKGIRRIFVVSKEPYTEKAEWFDESLFPFSKYDISFQILGDDARARLFLNSSNTRIGWIYQQFLKLYAPFVIPEISSNVLVLDADTIFLNPTEFIGPFGEGLYNPAEEFQIQYFEFMGRLLPGLTKVFPRYSGISHHMLMQREVLEDLFDSIETYHAMEGWKALCHCINRRYLYEACLSEYEIYFNFVFTKTDQMKIRPLKWTNIPDLSQVSMYRDAGYNYVSCHAWRRNIKS